MFADTTFKKFTIAEKDKLVGKLEINDNLVSKHQFIRPFIRELNSKMITKIGNRDYEKLNNYIINCMKDYYSRLTNNTSISEQQMMLSTYKHLYEMWTDLHNYKRTNNIVEMDKTYDLFSYELYVLGYNEF